MTPLERIFDLHRILSARRLPTPARALADELECTPATVKRLVAFMRDRLLAPIDSDRRGYRYRRDAETPAFQLPGLWFSAQELAALLTLNALLADAGPTLLSETLAPLRQQAEKLLSDRKIGLPDWPQRLRFLHAMARPAGPSFPIVADALARRRRLHIVYHARSTDARSEREISPQRLSHYRDNWYLDAWCHRADGLRIFSVDRIQQAQVLETRAHELPDADLDRVLATSFGIFAGEPTATAVLVFSAHAARWVADESWHPHQKSECMADGHLRLSLPYQHSEELLRQILGFGAEVEVLSPPELCRQVAQAHAAAARRYR